MSCWIRYTASSALSLSISLLLVAAAPACAGTLVYDLSGTVPSPLGTVSLGGNLTLDTSTQDVIAIAVTFTTQPPQAPTDQLTLTTAQYTGIVPFVSDPTTYEVFAEMGDSPIYPKSVLGGNLDLYLFFDTSIFDGVSTIPLYGSNPSTPPSPSGRYSGLKFGSASSDGLIYSRLSDNAALTLQTPEADSAAVVSLGLLALGILWGQRHPKTKLGGSCSAKGARGGEFIVTDQPE
jgi:hypothetical protein